LDFIDQMQDLLELKNVKRKRGKGDNEGKVAAWV